MFESVQIKTIPNRQIEAVLNYDLKHSKPKQGNRSERRDSFHRRVLHSMRCGLLAEQFIKNFSAPPAGRDRKRLAGRDRKK